ncbi:MAG: TAXI family TRAP transporter solute-binding subunit [Lachnospiraceae bacterium]|nr:TAXI family TRAP transporter solute-binding subunit [Lachnospiraceae bacterium]
MKNVKRISALLLALVLLFSLAACSGGDNKTTAAPSQGSESAATTQGAETAATQGTKKIDPLEIVTGSATGSWVSIGSAVAEAFNAFYEGFPATAIAGPGSMGNPSMLADGDGDISMSYAPFLVMAVNGDEPYTKAYPNLRAVASMQPTVLHWRITDDYDIYNATDFVSNSKSMTLGMSPKGNANYYFMKMIFNELGIDNDQDDLSANGIKLYFAESSGVTEAWKNRQCDSVINVGNIPYSNVMDALTGRAGHLINIDGDVAKALAEKYGFDTYVIKAGTYPGQDKDVTTIALKLVVIVREDMDEEIVYNLTKAIYENKDAFLNYHGSFAEFEPDTMAEGCGIELHPGAVKYYKEVGLIK